MTLALALVASLALYAAPDGGALQAYRAAEPATRATFELQDGGVIALPARADGGVVAVVLTPERAVQLANEHQDLAYENARLRAAEAGTVHPATVMGAILATIQLAFSAVPAIIDAARRQP